MRSVSELPVGWDDMVAQARAVRKNAYAPYSKFQVGAAVRVASGEVFAGCNVENASYGLTICAERVAAASAVAAGYRELELVCISLCGMSVPCGACRQFLHEFNPKTILLLDNDESPDSPEVVTLDALLPRGFQLDHS